MTTAFLNSQIKAIDKLHRVKCGALFMEAGTGKTRSAIELIENTDADYVLWITPYQTKENLREEINKWGGLSCDIVGVESIQNSDRIYLEHYGKVDRAKRAFVVCDESLKIKNAEAKRTRRVMSLTSISEYRLILNGTPLSRNLLDLWAQMEFLSPKILKMGLAEFKNTFCEYVRVTHRSIGSGNSYSKEFIKKYHNIDYLYSLIEPFIFESKLSLSIGKEHIDIRYDLTQEEKQHHEMLKAKYLNDDAMLAMNNNIFLEITQKMQHNYSLSPEKFFVTDKIIEGLDSNRVLIFAKYVDTQKALKSYYKNIEVKSIAKHSFGLNLQKYNTIIFWDKTWDYAQREQIERRIFRVGQKDTCTYYDLTGNVGLEYMINENIEKKRNLLDVFSEKTAGALMNQL